MADLILSDGREIVFDMARITVAEWRALLDRAQSPADEDATLAKAAGLAAGDIPKLSYLDWRKLAKAFYKAAASPLDDPS